MVALDSIQPVFKSTNSRPIHLPIHPPTHRSIDLHRVGRLASLPPSLLPYRVPAGGRAGLRRDLAIKHPGSNMLLYVHHIRIQSPYFPGACFCSNRDCKSASGLQYPREEHHIIIHTYTYTSRVVDSFHFKIAEICNKSTSG